MSITMLGAAANIFGIITPTKDLGEIIKGIADTVQEVGSFDNLFVGKKRDVRISR